MSKKAIAARLNRYHPAEDHQSKWVRSLNNCVKVDRKIGTIKLILAGAIASP